MMMNRQAITVSLPILPSAVMHDWWIAAMVIKHQGLVEFIDESLIQYRQHGSNSVGAKKNSMLSFIVRCFKYIFNQKIRSSIWHQAKSIEPNLSGFCFFWKKINIAMKSLF